MKKYTVTEVNTGALKISSTIDELQLTMVAHVISHIGFPGGDDVRRILAETKVGSRRKLELMQKLTGVFSGL